MKITSGATRPFGLYGKKCHVSRERLGGVAKYLTILALILSFTSADAANRVVTNATDRIDRTKLSLRQAIAASVPGDTITFNLPAGTVIPLGSELLVTVALLTITGPGADQLTIGRNHAAAPVSRIFNFDGRSIVSMTGLTIADGNLPAGSGAGILNAGRLGLANCVIIGNLNASSGGGLSNSGTLSLNGCTVSGNTTAQSGEFDGNHGGGIFNTGTLTVTSSTISGNVAIGSGGGVYNAGNATITNATIANNQANPVFNAIGGGGVSNDFRVNANAIVSASNVIVAGNTSSGTGPDFLGVITSQRYNLIGNISGTSISGDPTGNLYSVNPRLGALQNNGGPTKTHALLPGSPALDKGNSGGVATDQRGFPRPQDSEQIPNAPGGDASDMGAFEAPPQPPIQIVSIVRLSNGHIFLTCIGVPNAAHTVQASPDLAVGFSGIAVVVADSNGNFQSDDPGAVGLDQRFYRLAYP